MREYQGHRSWNAWNVSLWLNNDYALYSNITATYEAILASCGSPMRALRQTVNDFMRSYGGRRTPDGARYTRLAVSLAIADIVGMEV